MDDFEQFKLADENNNGEDFSQFKEVKSQSVTAPAQYDPIFSKHAEKYNVPKEAIVAIGHQESHFNPNAVGQQTKWGRAHGMMQYLQSEAEKRGIDPHNPDQAIEAAAQDMRKRLDKGYSLKEAIMAHFAGDNRELWKGKTHKYGQEVMDKAGLSDSQPEQVKSSGNIGDFFPSLASVKTTSTKETVKSEHKIQDFFPGISEVHAEEMPTKETHANSEWDDDTKPLTKPHENDSMLDKAKNPEYWKSLGASALAGVGDVGGAVGQVLLHTPLANVPDEYKDAINSAIERTGSYADQLREDTGRSGFDAARAVGQAAPVVAAELATGGGATPALGLSQLAKAGAKSGVYQAATTPVENASNNNLEFFGQKAKQGIEGALSGAVGGAVLGKAGNLLSKGINKLRGSNKLINPTIETFSKKSNELGDARSEAEISRLIKDVDAKKISNHDNLVRQSIAKDAGLNLRPSQSLQTDAAIAKEASLRKNPMYEKFFREQDGKQHQELFHSLDSIKSDNGSVAGAQYATTKFKDIPNELINDKHFLDKNIEKYDASQLNDIRNNVLATLKRVSTNKDGSFNASKYDKSLHDMGFDVKSDPFAEFKGQPTNLNLLFSPEQLAKLKNVSSTGKYLNQTEEKIKKLIPISDKVEDNSNTSSMIKKYGSKALDAALLSHPVTAIPYATLKAGKAIKDVVSDIKAPKISSKTLSEATEPFAEKAIKNSNLGNKSAKAGSVTVNDMYKDYNNKKQQQK